MKLRAYGGPKSGHVISIPPGRESIKCTTASDPGRWKIWRYDVHLAYINGKQHLFLLLAGSELPSAEQVAKDAAEVTV